MQTFGNGDDCNANIYKAWHRAFSNVHPFYQLLYSDSPDQMTVGDSVGNGNMALRNAKLSSDIST